MSKVKRKPLLSEILDEVSRHYSVNIADIVGRRISMEFVVPRHLAMFLAREMSGIPFEKIGEKFKRHHTTVIDAVESMRARLTKSQDLREDLMAIKWRLEEWL